MNHADAADLRDTLNEMRFVEGPNEDRTLPFRLVRVQQPGYLNGEAIYEVLINVDDDHLHLPSDFLSLVTQRGCYLRIQDGTIHIRDWQTEEVDDGE